jgi:hypothetical protein
MDSLIKCKIFAYGITGAGKTYTMDGTALNAGVIPRAVQYIFGKINTAQRKRSDLSEKITHQLAFSHVEIYNEKVIGWCLAAMAYIRSTT